MKLRLPRHDQYNSVKLEVSGPNTLLCISTNTDDHPEIERDFGVDEGLLTVKAWHVNNAGEPVGDEIVLKEADEKVPLEDDKATSVEETVDLAQESAPEVKESLAESKAATTRDVRRPWICSPR